MVLEYVVPAAFIGWWRLEYPKPATIALSCMENAQISVTAMNSRMLILVFLALWSRDRPARGSHLTISLAPTYSNGPTIDDRQDQSLQEALKNSSIFPQDRRASGSGPSAISHFE